MNVSSGSGEVLGLDAWIVVYGRVQSAGVKPADAFDDRGFEQGGKRQPRSAISLGLKPVDEAPASA
jgi:hypothetical protein